MTQDGKPFFNFTRHVITGGINRPRLDSLPPITESQAEALDMVHFTAQANEVRLSLQAGDLFFLNNLAAFHSRGHFEDDEINKRHLTRLWLHNSEKSWLIPETLKKFWDTVFMDLPDRPGWFILDPYDRDTMIMKEIRGDHTTTSGSD